MANRNWRYEKMGDDMSIISCPIDDKDGSVTGRIILNVPAYFDENPQERIRLGWTKHITHSTDEVEYNHQTQFLVVTTLQVDDYTVEDEYHVLNKSDEQLLFEDMLDVAMGGNGIIFY